MAVKKLLPTYLEMLEVKEDSEVFNTLTPTSVHVLTTACDSVYDHFLKTLSRDIRNKGVKKNSLSAVLRLLVESGVNDTMASMSAVFCKRYSEADGAVPLDKIRTLAGRLTEAKLRGASVVLSPRFDFRVSAYKKSLTTGVDVVLKEDGKAELMSILTSKKYTENEAPAIDPQAILLKMLMYLNSEPFVTHLKYTLVTAGAPGVPDMTYTLLKKELQEDVATTIRRLVSWYGISRKIKGKHCADCVHSSYCMVLAEELKENADKAKEKENENS
jgi:hypothetical protein